MEKEKILWMLLLVLVLGLMSGCQQTECPEIVVEVTSTPVSHEISNPTQEYEEQKEDYEEIILTFEENGTELPDIHYPDLWTNIDKSKISIFSFSELHDFIYAEDGTLWMVGSFGVIKQQPNGAQTWYSIKNGLPRQHFSEIAIASDGQVWIGGPENALLRFDGENWIDEGIKLPESLNQKAVWTCYSKRISGIDFGPDGIPWIMNNGIDIYTQVFGQWVNFGFPKALLSPAGGGGCPIGFRVVSERNITIKRSGCCGSEQETAYHFDGISWKETNDYSIVDELISQRHESPEGLTPPVPGKVSNSGVIDWPFKKEIDRISKFPFLVLDESEITCGYLLEDGLYCGDQQEKEFIGKIPGEIYKTGVAFQSSDGSVLVSTPGNIWKISTEGKWIRYRLSSHPEILFQIIIEQKDGAIIAATDTGVVIIQQDTYTYTEFTKQHRKPIVNYRKWETDECAEYNRFYSSGPYWICDETWNYPNYDFQYNILYMGSYEGEIIYLNNKIIAQYKDGEWGSFLFDSIEFNSATMDPEGNIYVISADDGMFSFSPNIFDDYEGMGLE